MPRRFRLPWWLLLTLSLVLCGADCGLAEDGQTAFEDAHEQSIELYNSGKYVEAVEAAKHALNLAEQAEDVRLTTTALHSLGKALHAAGRPAEAVPILQRNLALREKSFGPEHEMTASACNALAGLYHDLGRLAEAEKFYRRVLAIDEKEMEPDDATVARDVNNLGLLLLDAGRYAEAETLLLRSRDIRVKVFGEDSVQVASALNNLGGVVQAQGRLAEAEPMLERALAIREKEFGSEHLDIADQLNTLGSLYKDQGRYEKAGTAYERALAIRTKNLGAEHPAVATTLNNLSLLRDAEGRKDIALDLQKQSLAIRETVLGPDHPDVAVSLGNMASLLSAVGRYAEAESFDQRALALREKLYGPDHIDVALTLNNLAQTMQEDGRNGEARPLFERALAVYEKTLGPVHPYVAALLNNLSALERAQDDDRLALAHSERALAIREKLFGPEHLNVAESLNSIALALQGLERDKDAEPYLQRSLAIREKVLGPDHPGVAVALNNLAALYRALDRAAEAEPLYQRSHAILERTLGPDHPDTANVLSNIAELNLRTGNWQNALDYWGRSTGLLLKRHAVSEAGQQLGGKGSSTLSRVSHQTQLLVKAAHRLASEAGADAAAVKERMFLAGQWAAGSEAADAVAQTAARSAKGVPDLEPLVREKQDLVAQWRTLDQRRTAAAAQPPDRRRPDEESAMVRELAGIELRLAGIGNQLKTEFPDYAALASAEPIAVADVQESLRADEVLLSILVTGELKGTAAEETYVWAVTKSESRWRKAAVLPARIRREVQALRCGLDAAAWATANRAEECAALLNLTAAQLPKDDGPLPFDHARAHRLYTALFSGLEDMIANKHILAVISSPLNVLPLGVLITAPPQGKDNQRIEWLARKNPITVLPSVASLKALRRVTRPSGATAAFIGFGNPLLDGDQAHAMWGAYYRQRAGEARAAVTCSGASVVRTAELRSVPRAVSMPGQVRRRIDPVSIRSLAPLPETADELCAVARELDSGGSTTRLGPDATETSVKEASASGDLARYRVIHFATHGALTGQLEGATEPGLILTPPATASETDDGYLAASEIAQLKIDADWVILSACNTAGGEASGSGSESLSGLARAFFYAGARSLLVSHWEVSSEAAVKVVTAAVGATARDRALSRTQALRGAILKLIDGGNTGDSHPSIWAPFVLVGEGAAARPG